MKTQKTITVIIDKQGNPTIEASGFTGDACLKETKGIEEALGKLSDRSLKPEAMKTTTIADKTKVGR